MLVVEDDALVQSWIRLALERTEFRLAGVASSAAEAQELIERRQPDLLLVDYRLPDGVGTELVGRLRQQGLMLPAMMMTANLEPGFNEAAREAGAQGSVLKSGSIDALLNGLRAVAAGEEAFDGRHPKPPPGQGLL